MDNEEILLTDTQQPPDDAREDIAPGAEERTDGETLEQLRAEVKRLEDELERKQAEAEKIHAQLAEFADVFPDSDVRSLPEDVWESVRSGNSLAAAYALYTQRLYNRERLTRSVNDRNAMVSSGRITGNTPEYFTPSEVRAMSQSEVHANFSKIKESMKKWN